MASTDIIIAHGIWCLLNKVVLAEPADFESEFDACVEIAREALEAQADEEASS